MTMLGYDRGEMLLYNFWRDGKVRFDIDIWCPVGIQLIQFLDFVPGAMSSQNPKGLWRKTTLSSYQSPQTQWTTVLDLDALAKSEDISWVWKGFIPLPRSLDPLSGDQNCDHDQSATPSGRVTRVLFQLSRGGADATYLREFDLLTESFVDPESEESGFALPEGKTRASWKSRDLLFVGADVGEDAMTTSGYPRTVREWRRGTKVEEAPIVFEVEKTDVSCSQYLCDERHREGGGMYEMQCRSISFYNSTYFVKKEPSEEFVKLAVAMNTEVSFFGKWMILLVKTDWEAHDNGSERTFKTGSLLYVDSQSFLDFSKAKESGPEDAVKEAAAKLDYKILFEPTSTTSYAGYSTTKNYLILYILEDVKEKLEFFKLGEGGGEFIHVGGDDEGKIRSASARGVDSKSNDLFWFTTSSYTQPSTLYLADANKSIDSNGKGQGDDYVLSQLKSLPDMYDSSNLEVQQLFATSKDGTRIPYFIISKKGLALDGTNPTLLYGYGGFEISLGPHYIATAGISWLERGGVYVEANIRGGGEYGPQWHQSALKENRNKSYEDFIAVAKHLISSKVCTPQTLACRGGSNGGLLTGNMLVQAPDLFGAIHIAVPLLDMKRYHKLLAGVRHLHYCVIQVHNLSCSVSSHQMFTYFIFNRHHGWQNTAILIQRTGKNSSKSTHHITTLTAPEKNTLLHC